MRQQGIFLLYLTDSDHYRRQKTLVGYWCSQGLTNIRAACEVFQQARLVLSCRGDWSRQEEQELALLLSSHGRDWQRISSELR